MMVMRLTGHVLLWIGFLSAAFVAVRHTEITETPWASIEWGQYLATLAVAVVGMVLLRMTSRPGAAGPARVTGRVEDLEETLSEVIVSLESMTSQWAPEQVYSIHGRIDAELAERLADFADNRQALVRAFGLRAYGQIMSNFASGERMVHRAWCASADGYADEVKKCLDQAIGQLAAALATIRRLA